VHGSHRNLPRRTVPHIRQNHAGGNTGHAGLDNATLELYTRPHIQMHMPTVGFRRDRPYENILAQHLRAGLALFTLLQSHDITFVDMLPTYNL